MKTKFSGILTLLLAFVVQVTFAQQQTVTGTVTDDTGLPLPGVNVLVQGTTRGVQTDFDGEFSIEASQGEVLVFSYLGMKTVTFPIGNTNIIDVTLEADAAQLEEVIVTGYGIERAQRETTYQTQSVGEEELTIASPVSAGAALAGKVSGLQINVQNNGVNPSSQILLRGLRSITQSNSALIVIDGAISTQGAFDDLNPSDIESLNVLKGATAAALYGSSAGNGALIVITKKGSSEDGGFRVGVNSTTTFEEVAYMPDFQEEYGTGWQGAYDPVENTNWGPRFDGLPRQIGPTFADGTFQEVPYAPVKDNLKDFYNTGLTLQNTVYLSGADENSSIYMSVGSQETTGIVPNDTYKRKSFRVNATQKLGDLELSLNSSYFTDKTSVVGSTIGSQNRSLYWFVLNTSANIPLSSYKDWRNDLYASPDGFYNAYYQNPYWAVDTNRNNDETARLNANMSASYDIAEWLNFTARFGLNQNSGTGKNYRAFQAYTSAYTRPDDQSSFVEDSEFQQLIYTTDAILNANFDATEDFSVQAILGATNYTNEFRSSTLRANNLSIPDFYDISNGTGELAGSVNEEVRRNYGFFGDVTVGYKNFLFLNFSGRQDYTSTLAAGNNSYFYPAFGASVVLSDVIPAITNNDIINYLKVTGSNSTVYNDLGAYAINEVFSQSSTFPYGSINGFFLGGTTVDANISKEKINTTEFGANFGFFRNRVTLDATYFKTFTTDLITSTVPAPSSGADFFLTNIGELEGSGVELSLGARIFDTDNFGWNVNVNYTTNETVVNEINDALNEVAVSTTGEVGVYAVVGEAFPQIKGTSYVRDPQGRIVVDDVTGNPLAGPLKNLGKTTPDYTVGLTSTLRVKDFQLAATLDYRTGHVYYSQLADVMEFTGRSMESVSANRQDFVFPNSVIETSEGVYVENTNLPITAGGQDFWTENYNSIKENYVRDATAFKVREIALNYILPEKYLDNTGLNRLTIGVVGRNLFTFLPEENRFADPEFNNTNSNAIGISGFFQSPPTRSYGVSINIEL